MMKTACIVMAIFLGSKANSTQELVISDYGYFFNGVIAEQVSEFDHSYDPEISVSIFSCTCADTILLTTALEWLYKKGAEKFFISAVPNESEELCGECK
ncbi:MAG: hypothetical protein AAF446_02755 [Pseudomonadota bacterium]